MCFCFGVGQAKGVLVCGAQCQVCLCAGVRVVPFLEGVKVLRCFQAGDQSVRSLGIGGLSVSADLHKRE